MAEFSSRSCASPVSALDVTLGSALLDLETSRVAERTSYKTNIKSLDAQLGDLFGGGKVIAIGHLDAEDDVEEVYPIRSSP